MRPDEQREHVLGLDLMRTLAILLVIASHCTNNISFWFGYQPPQTAFFAGELGVDLFFALSGFLIGRILIDIAARAPTARNLLIFLVRRWMRTLPAYLTTLLAIALLFPPAAHLAEYLAHFATLTQNLFRPMPADWWFAVSWSLTIEEWFYLLFGSGAILAAALLRQGWAMWLPLAALLVAPPLLRLSVSPATYFDAGYWKMVPFRLDEIGYGVVCARLYARRTWMFRHPIGPFLVGLLLVAAAWTAYLPLPAQAFVAFQNTMAVIGCALCIPLALRLHRAPRWLDALGRHGSRLSYSLYLVHLTVLVDVAQSLWWRHWISAPVAVVVAFGGMLLAAEALSRGIEQPLMRRRPRQFPATMPAGEPARDDRPSRTAYHAGTP